MDSRGVWWHGNWFSVWLMPRLALIDWRGAVNFSGTLPINAVICMEIAPSPFPIPSPESKSLGYESEKEKPQSINNETRVKEETHHSYYLLWPPRHLLLLTARTTACTFVCLCGSSLDLHVLFLAAVGPVGWGLSLSYMTREQIDMKHTQGQSLCKQTVWHHNSAEHEGQRPPSACS